MNNLIKELNYYNYNIDSAFKIPHFHNGYELIYVVDGSVSIEINNARYDVVAPSVILLNPFEWHKILHSDNNYLRYTVVADSDILEREVNPKIISAIKCRPDGFKHVMKLDRETTFYINRIFSILEKEYKNQHFFSDRLIANEMYNLLILIYRMCNAVNKTYNEYMMHVQIYIDDNFKTIKNIDSIAKKFYLTPEHLSRAFKIYSGYTPIEYLLNTRLYHAQLLVLSSSMSTMQICEEVGFRDINNFTRQFRLKYGMPPMAFRKYHSINNLKSDN